MSDSIQKNELSSQSKLLFAIIINILLTLFQIVGGVLSGSLALAADALHNLSDALALGIAWLARLIAHKPSDGVYTYGYSRSEMIGAMINLTSLIIIGIYLIYEGIYRLIEPAPVHGMQVIYVAIIALIVDILTSLLVYRGAKNSINIKAAFLHNISDALASLGVIVSGVLIAKYNLYIADAIITLVISGLVLYQGFKTIPKVIKILMQAVPSNIDLGILKQNVKQIEGIRDFHHIHIWRLDEKNIFLEAHASVDITLLSEVIRIKNQIKVLLLEKYNISHSTIELEFNDNTCNAEICGK
jgi:cobalt-zinc-cadmium efflux system protein